MSGDAPIRLSLARPEESTRRPGSEPPGELARELPGAPLFRREAMQAVCQPLHGEVTVAVPPGGLIAAALSVMSLLLLLAAAYVVEVPQRASAVGILMPPEGFLKVVAADAAQVHGIAAAEGERVTAGQPLLLLGTDRGSLPLEELQSLERERDLLLRAQGRRERMQAERLRAVDEQVASITRRLGFAKDEIGIQEAQNALVDARLGRLTRLAAEGTVAAAQLDDEKLQSLKADGAAALLQRQAAQIEDEREGLARVRADLVEQAELRQVEYEIAGQQLQRRIAALENVLRHELRAPEDGVVARVTVRPGQSVRPGQTLVTLHRGGAALQAWLYLTSANAGLLRVGQEVALRLDSYPHQMFGTPAATISSISSIPLMPSELDVPLALNGPVFEVRATLARQSIRAQGMDWPLATGTAFRADIVQHRYRLYEWLLRMRRGSRGLAGDGADG